MLLRLMLGEKTLSVDFFFQHGWAFGAAFWQPVVEQLAKTSQTELSFDLADRGYAGEVRHWRGWRRVSHQREIVCHSLGLHLVPEEAWKDASQATIIGGFLYFHGEEQREIRTSRQIVKRMLSLLPVDPVHLLNEFYDNCSKPAPYECISTGRLSKPGRASIDLIQLQKDLELLNESRFDISLINHLPKIKILHGEEDRIVALSHSRKLLAALPQANLIVLPNTGHIPAVRMLAPLLNETQDKLALVSRHG